MARSCLKVSAFRMAKRKVKTDCDLCGKPLVELFVKHHDGQDLTMSDDGDFVHTKCLAQPSGKSV